MTQRRTETFESLDCRIFTGDQPSPLITDEEQLSSTLPQPRNERQSLITNLFAKYGIKVSYLVSCGQTLSAQDWSLLRGETSRFWGLSAKILALKYLDLHIV